jgi:hypothetical protein
MPLDTSSTPGINDSTIHLFRDTLESDHTNNESSAPFSTESINDPSCNISTNFDLKMISKTDDSN